MAITRSLLRGAKLAGYFVRFGLELFLRRPQSRAARADWLHRFCATAIRGLGVQVSVEGPFPPRCAVISNHLSYLDIIVFAAVHPCVFCSKSEIEAWPLIGWMTTMSGTVYVERGRGGSALNARGGMQAAADATLPVVFFPEGTTTNGDALLPFHSGLLAQAMAVEEPITAASIWYTLEQENDPAISVADDVCFWGETPMLPHIFRFLGLRGVHARVRFAPRPIAFSTLPLHRKLAAVEARKAVLALVAQDYGQGLDKVEPQITPFATS